MTAKLRPFFCYYGSKWRIAPKYPAPRYDTIIEPFAGSAGYSLRHPSRRVLLYDLDTNIVQLWQYLIQVRETEIRSLPEVVNHLDDHPRLTQEARLLISFNLNPGAAGPRKSMTVRGRISPGRAWGGPRRERIASQLQYIRHWKAECAHYLNIPCPEATWFIDPPYQGVGHHYRVNRVQYNLLAWWCRRLRGQATVCENYGATWLPFQPFVNIQGSRKKSREVVWYGPDSQQDQGREDHRGNAA